MDYTINKTLIKSIYLTGIAATCLAASCKLKEEEIREQEAWQKKTDSIGNAMLDSIYIMESLRCDSVKKMRLQMIADSMVAADSSNINKVKSVIK